jgi:AraC-like DNA-binding protein
VTDLMPTATPAPPSQPAWEMEVRRPGPLLRGIVGDLAGYREVASAPVRRRELPAARIVMIFNLGAPLRMAQPHGPGELIVPQGRGFIAGLHETYTLTDTSGQQEGLEVRLSPAGAYQLFGIPMREFANRTHLLEEVAPAWHRNLVEQLLHAPDWDTRFRMAELALIRKPHGQVPDVEVVWAWRQLRQSRGQIPISSLVTELGWSHSRLVTRFREQIGMTPKQCARLLRFQQVVQHPSFAPGADWCAVAQACGFYDQSHLIREVRAFAGDTPEGLARRRMIESAGYAAGVGDQQ